MSFGGGGSGGGSIASGSDVSLNNPATGQFLGYNGATSKWENALANDANAVHKGDFVYNVKDYGALGDGVADDTAGITAAINAAAASAYGGIVFLSPGYYKTNGGHLLPPKVSLQGAGMQATTIEHKGANTFCFQIGPTPVQGSPAPDYTNKVSGFMLLGQSGASTATQTGILVYNCIFYDLSDIYVKHCHDAFLFDGGVGGTNPTDTFAGLGMATNLHAVNNLIGFHLVNWVTDTTMIHCYAYSSGAGTKGFYLENKIDTCNFISPSVEGVEVGYHISSIGTLAGVVWISPREESCTTPVLWDNNSNGHTIIGASSTATGISSPWFPMTAAANNAQICFDGYFPTVTSLPAPNSDMHGAIFRIRGGTGTADSLNVCKLNADGSYSWKDLLA
ncbi:MAG TPA: glycosyl hydrolase family 28-related protein [Candidatus Saccharimonadales bacterium]|nr:glycosyl hydrolase family 28-related protein [Candidatus Saccharimonadales bacterium]